MNANNAQIASTLLQLQTSTSALAQTTANLSAQVTTITNELTGVAAILKGLKDKMDNYEVNLIAPEAKQARIEAEAANGC